MEIEKRKLTSTIIGNVCIVLCIILFGIFVSNHRNQKEYFIEQSNFDTIKKCIDQKSREGYSIKKLSNYIGNDKIQFVLVMEKE